ncbi:MAG: HAD family hydrolase [Vulcanimicrobiota bacterium]
MINALLLFDIDGTLVMPGHTRHGDAIQDAVACHTGKQISPHEVDPDGKTDSGIILEMLCRAGCAKEKSQRLLPLVLETMAEKFISIREDLTPFVYPEALQALGSLSKHSRYILGLLTGNHENVAWHKLRMAGIDHYFSLGSFGNESVERHALVPIAVKRAERKCGCSISTENVAVIGDTPRDIACGKRNNVRTVAVATGASPLSELLQHGADLTLIDLGEFEKITDLLFPQNDKNRDD